MSSCTYFALFCYTNFDMFLYPMGYGPM